MTAAELIQSALAELDHPADTAALPLWKEKLLRFANEAINDLFETFRPWRRDPLPIVNGSIDLTALPHAVNKLLGVERCGMRIPFFFGADTNTLRVPGVPDGTMTVVYRYAPEPLIEDDDEPALPAACHPLIVLYMTGRFSMHNDAPGMNHASAALSLYETQKRRLKLEFDEPTDYRITNRW
ncbi:MAG: hypothetical protein II117_01815 [Clostridia bacterium]|nr:hypothetical protein [Clostridia bacterium]